MTSVTLRSQGRDPDTFEA